MFNPSFVLETETFVQANLKPLPKIPAQSPVAAVQKIQEPSEKQHQQPLAAPEEKEKPQTVANQSAQGISPAVITTLLLIPLVVVIAIGVFIRWKKGRMYNGNCETFLMNFSMIVLLMPFVIACQIVFDKFLLLRRLSGEVGAIRVNRWNLG